MAGKVRIFELAKEVGLTSKELTALFNDRLGGVFEAKNQLSVVPDQIADLVRAVLLKSVEKPPARPKTSPASASATAAKAAAVKPATAKKPAATSAPAPTTAPVARLRPVTTRAVARPADAAPPAPEPAAPVVEAAAVASEVVEAAAPRKPAPAPRPASEPIFQLRPVPAGQPSVQKRQAPPPAATAASASPGPRTGLPGRPGVAPRPGEVMPGQGGKGTGAPARGPIAPRPLPPPRRPAGNGPFRPLSPGTRPAPGRPGGGPATEAPTPSSGARPGDRARSHEEKATAKKDREKELLLEKERQRKKKGGSAPAPVRALETIEIPDLLTVQELATSMIVPARDVITELIKIGTMATINQNISSDVAIQIAKRFGYNAVVKEAGEEVTVEQEEDKPEMMTPRPPVVTVLGPRRPRQDLAARQDPSSERRGGRSGRHHAENRRVHRRAQRSQDHLRRYARS